MAKRRLSFSPNQYYHIFNRGANRQDIFRTDADYNFLLRSVKFKAGISEISIIAYCLMSNHYHLLLRQDGTTPISLFLQAVFNVYAKAFNAKYGHSGTIFEGPYKAIHVDQDAYLLHLCRYIHRNPVEAGLVAGPEQWVYSNYAGFVDERSDPFVDLAFIRRNFGAGDKYREFVLDYDPPEKIQKEFRRYIFTE